MGFRKLPNTAALQAERDSLTVEKQKEYGEYQKIHFPTKDMDTIKRNMGSLLYVQKLNKQKNRLEREWKTCRYCKYYYRDV